MTTKQFKLAINRLFKLLNESKCFAKQKFLCCRSCAWGAFEDPYENGYFVFTTDQSCNDYKEGFQYIYGKYPEQILPLIHVCGLNYVWDFTEDTAIKLLPMAKPIEGAYLEDDRN